MAQEERDLLLKDLCARLPYHPIAHVEHDIVGLIETADLQVYGYEGNLKLLREDNETFCYLPIEECKLYLRPMSSMTEEERKYLQKLPFPYDFVDWLNAHYFDYCNLIAKGLALEATSEMYK